MGVELTSTQEERARSILERLVNDEIRIPTDFIDSWETPESHVDYSKYEGSFPRQHQYINPAKIGGALGSDKRLEPGRLGKILKWMITGGFEQERMCPPMLQK